MLPIKKVYGYITRIRKGKVEILVFRHSNPKAGIQIPKGTVEPKESTYHAVIREVKEETGLKDFKVNNLIAEDYWRNNDYVIHHRYFYQINISNAPDRWDYKPIGGGDEKGLTFHYFWISAKDEVELVKGHGDYLNKIFG